MGHCIRTTRIVGRSVGRLVEGGRIITTQFGSGGALDKTSANRKKGLHICKQITRLVWDHVASTCGEDVPYGRPPTSKQARTQPLSLLASNVIFQLQIGIHAALIYGVSLPPASAQSASTRWHNSGRRAIRIIFLLVVLPQSNSIFFAI